MLKTIVNYGCKITYMTAKLHDCYKRKIFRRLLGIRTDNGKTSEICMLPPIG